MKSHTKEYIEKIFEIKEKGGILWLIERTDTYEFIEKMSNVCHKPTRNNVPHWRWDKSIGIFTEAFLTKEDAEAELLFINTSEGGCPTCGHGSRQLPVVITEHLFTP